MPPDISPQAFMAIPLLDLVMFSMLFGARSITGSGRLRTRA